MLSFKAARQKDPAIASGPGVPVAQSRSASAARRVLL
jgi:hypothetical protein